MTARKAAVAVAMFIAVSADAFDRDRDGLFARADGPPAATWRAGRGSLWWSTEGPTRARFEAGPTAVVFLDDETGELGRLYLERPMRFEGDAAESARVFFDALADLGVAVCGPQ